MRGVAPFQLPLDFAHAAIALVEGKGASLGWIAVIALPVPTSMASAVAAAGSARIREVVSVIRGWHEVDVGLDLLEFRETAGPAQAAYAALLACSRPLRSRRSSRTRCWSIPFRR
jgi:hypothetical protein